MKKFAFENLDSALSEAINIYSAVNVTREHFHFTSNGRNFGKKSALFKYKDKRD